LCDSERAFEKNGNLRELAIFNDNTAIYSPQPSTMAVKSSCRLHYSPSKKLEKKWIRRRPRRARK
jgi:hypothetical protein